jgi:hypothetical protein
LWLSSLASSCAKTTTRLALSVNFSNIFALLYQASSKAPDKDVNQQARSKEGLFALGVRGFLALGALFSLDLAVYLALG